MYKQYTVPNLSVLTLTVTVSTIYSEHDTTGQLCLEVFPFIGIVRTIIIVISKYECEQWSMDKFELPSPVFCDWSETSLSCHSTMEHTYKTSLLFFVQDKNNCVRVCCWQPLRHAKLRLGNGWGWMQRISLAVCWSDKFVLIMRALWNYNMRILLPFWYDTIKFRNVCTLHECRSESD